MEGTNVGDGFALTNDYLLYRGISKYVYIGDSVVSSNAISNFVPSNRKKQLQSDCTMLSEDFLDLTGDVTYKGNTYTYIFCTKASKIPTSNDRIPYDSYLFSMIVYGFKNKIDFTNITTFKETTINATNALPDIDDYDLLFRFDNGADVFNKCILQPWVEGSKYPAFPWQFGDATDEAFLARARTGCEEIIKCCIDNPTGFHKQFHINMQLRRKVTFTSNNWSEPKTFYLKVTPSVELTNNNIDIGNVVNYVTEVKF